MNVPAKLTALLKCAVADETHTVLTHLLVPSP